jgi:hypothetical protein
MHIDDSWISDVGVSLFQDADLTLFAHGLLSSKH